MQPLGDCVLVEEEPFESYEKHIGLSKIITPEQYSHGPKDRTPWGKVVAFGELCRKVVSVGDRVAWGKWAGVRFPKGDKTLVLVREHDLIAKS